MSGSSLRSLLWVGRLGTRTRPSEVTTLLYLKPTASVSQTPRNNTAGSCGSVLRSFRPSRTVRSPVATLTKSIFPEGTRSDSGSPLPSVPGSARGTSWVSLLGVTLHQSRFLSRSAQLFSPDGACRPYRLRKFFKPTTRLHPVTLYLDFSANLPPGESVLSLL